MVELIREIISILVAGISGLATGIGQGVQEMATALFIDTTGDTTALSVFGGIVVVFAGVSLAVGLTLKVFNYITSLGNRY